MSKFPSPLPLPKDVYYSRAKRNKQVIKGALLGIKFRFLVIGIELLANIKINSLVLLYDALSSLIDVGTTLFLIFCLKLAHKPPDKNHPFGHGRYEPLCGLLMGVFIAVSGFILAIKQFHGVIEQETTSHFLSYAWLVPLSCMGILEYSYRSLKRIADQEHSPALAADALHYRIDSLTSLFAALTLLAGAYLSGWSLLIDHLGAIAIALFMVVNGFLASKANFHQLMDKAPDPGFFALVKEAALQTSGVREVEKIRIQQYGPDAHVDIDVEVNPDLTVDKAHKISQAVRIEIQKSWPAVRDVTVHIEPYYANDH